MLVYQCNQLIGVVFMMDQLQLLCQQARVKPSFVQNRCYANQSWDKEIRAYCEQMKIMYQGFSLLTANMDILRA